MGLQIASLGLLTELLSINNLAIYFSIISMGSILFMFVDLGFIRYSYMLINNKIDEKIVINQALRITKIGFFIMAPIFIWWCFFKNYSIYWAILIIVSNLLNKFYNLNRYFFIHDNKISWAIAIEGLQPILYFFFLSLVVIFSHYSSPNKPILLCLHQVFMCYMFSFSFAFLISVILSRKTFSWLKSLSFISIKTNRSIIKDIQLSFPVGIEMILNNIWFNLLVVLSNTFFSVEITAIIGIFQRLLNFANAFISISVVANLKKYYNETMKKKFFLLLIMVSIGLFVITGVGLELFSTYSSFLFSPDMKTQVFELLTKLSHYPFSIAFCISICYLYSNLSFAALGADKRLLRILSTSVGLGAVVVCLLSIIFIFDLKTSRNIISLCITAMGISILLASFILAFGLSKEEVL